MWFFSVYTFNGLQGFRGQNDACLYILRTLRAYINVNVTKFLESLGKCRRRYSGEKKEEEKIRAMGQSIRAFRSYPEDFRGFQGSEFSAIPALLLLLYVHYIHQTIPRILK